MLNRRLSAPRWTLPDPVRGSSSTNQMRRGILCGDRRPATQRRSAALVQRALLTQYHSRRHLLPEPGIRDGERRGIRDRRMSTQDLIDLGWSDLLAAAVDHLAQPSGDEQIALVVEVAEVPGAVPPAGEERRRGRLWIVQIAREDAGSPDRDLAHHSRGERVPIRGANHDLQPGPGEADRARLTGDGLR